jgi:isocitrate dehydrogenase
MNNTKIARFAKLEAPANGGRILIDRKKRVLVVPDNPVIPVIRGDGTGRDIMKAAKRVLSAAVDAAYGTKRGIVWFDCDAGEDAMARYGPDTILPEDTVKALKHYVVSLKGPLTTPVGKGFRSINVQLRILLDLYACIRPCRYIPGIPSPVRRPEKVNIVVFREATEDVYAGFEWKQGTKEADSLIKHLNARMKTRIRPDSGIGVKNISRFCTVRLMDKAMAYALRTGRKSITIMHKGNIMKYTEGAFRDWCYERARKKFASQTVTEDELYDKYDGRAPEGRVVIKDRIADSIFQQVLTRPDEYDIIITPNLNGDYIADALAAQVGGLGVAPSSNIGDYHALFEATHGSAPKYADKDVINPSAVIMSGVEMLKYLGWNEAAEACSGALAETIKQGRVTYDLHRLMEAEGRTDARKLKCSEFGDAVISNMRPTAG